MAKYAVNDNDPTILSFKAKEKLVVGPYEREDGRLLTRRQPPVGVRGSPSAVLSLLNISILKREWLTPPIKRVVVRPHQNIYLVSKSIGLKRSSGTKPHKYFKP